MVKVRLSGLSPHPAANITLEKSNIMMIKHLVLQESTKMARDAKSYVEL